MVIKLNRLWPVEVIFSLALALPIPAGAAPIDWQGQWMVQVDQGQVRGDGTIRQAFGASATLDGQSVDLDADSAHARADAVVLDNDSSAQAIVRFERSFRLADSPNGWLLNLQGELTGRLSIDLDPALLGYVNIFARAAIFDNNGQIAGFDENGRLVGTSIRIFREWDLEGGVIFSADPATDSAFLDDGLYWIKGSLIADARSGKPPRNQFPPVFARSLFFDDGWAVSISATPVPEPSTPLLIGAALVAMAAVGRRTHPRRITH